MRIWPNRRAATIAAAVCLSVATAGGCADDGNGSSTTTNPTPPGEPIKFSVLYPEGGTSAAPELLAGAQAAANAINDAGGVEPRDGGDARPIELVPCDADTSTNPSNAVDCAKRVSDAGIVLDVGKYTLAGDEVDVLSQAGIAMLGTNPFSQNDLTNELAYPLAGAGASLVPGTAAVLQSAGAKKIAYLSLDIPAAHAAADFITPILDDPSDMVATTLLPTDPSADLTAYWTKLADAEPDGIILGVPPGLTPQAVNGLRAAGFDGVFAATPYTLTAEAIDGLGADGEGMLVASNYEALASSTTNAEIEAFRDEMDQYAPDAALDEFSLNAWLSVHLAAEIAAELETIDATSFAKALDGREVDLGVAPAFTLGVQDIYLPFPRVSRATIQPQRLADGEITADGDWIDLNDRVG